MQHRLSRHLATVAFVAGFAALLAGCGGGSVSPVVPKSQTSPAQSVRPVIHPMIKISRASIPSVMAKLLKAGAYASPIKGHKPVRLHVNTVSAGMDLTYNGGPYLTGASVYNILVNCNDESCWGGLIGQFESDFFSSNMINILSQYIGTTAQGAFSDGGDYPVQYNTSQTLGDQDIDNIVYQVITQNNLPTGYNAIYNVFLGQGVQECSQAAGGCYLQQYCAYHGSNDYSDIGHVLYTVEPYQDVQGCQVSNLPSPNGSLVDSTSSTLSHETSETITDPDVAVNNIAWYNQQGGEIGDLCAPAVGVPTGNVTLGADTYEIQMEYDNNIHDCSFSP